jgi:DNA-binding transcriptional regulator GbsR (MarR family)
MRTKKFDPLSNKSTSKVFYELLKGCSTTKEITLTLGLSPQSVFEHLKRLEEIKVVKLGEKKGKFQEYVIDYEKFISLFIERTMKEKNSHIIKTTRKEIREIKTLITNKYFEYFIKRYILLQGLNATIAESANRFEETLRHIKTLKKKITFDNSEAQAFFGIMKKWQKAVEDVKTFTDLNATNAFRDVLIKINKE